MDKEYSDKELLSLLMDYIEQTFNLREDSSVIVFYNEGFYFNCVEKKTMTSISKININEILAKCNSVDSKDCLFRDSEDLLNELNLLTKDRSIVSYVVGYLRDTYGISCINDES